MAREVFHVAPAAEGKWSVDPEDARHTGEVFDHKDDAVRHAKDQAKAAHPGQIIVHGRDGRIQYENTYRQDPHRRKG